MNLPETVKRYLANSGGRFKVRRGEPVESFDGCLEAAGISPSQCVRAELLKSGRAYLMAVYRADRELDLNALNSLFKRDFVRADEADVHALFSNCNPAMLPPVSEAYGIKAIVDKRVDELESLYFSSGEAGLFIHADKADFDKLMQDAWQGKGICREAGAEAEVVEPLEGVREHIRTRIRDVQELPAMPGIATEIIRIRNNPYAHASELASVIEQDPSLAAQLIRYATSPLYAYQGKVESVEQAIVRVLGMDFVQDIAFGLSLGRSFRNPKEGPLGLNAFWNHALHSAALVQSLCNAIEFSRRPPASMGYLAGLLHNFGFLLLGHLFPAQFERLNRTLAEYPERSLEELELKALGVTHGELGSWLMEAWEMPREIIEAVGEHHDPDHYSDYSVYANLVLIANRLLSRHGIGEAESSELPAELLARLGLSEAAAERALEQVLSDAEGLEFMARKMAA